MKKQTIYISLFSVLTLFFVVVGWIFFLGKDEVERDRSQIANRFINENFDQIFDSEKFGEVDQSELESYTAAFEMYYEDISMYEWVYIFNPKDSRYSESISVLIIQMDNKGHIEDEPPLLLFIEKEHDLTLEQQVNGVKSLYQTRPEKFENVFYYNPSMLNEDQLAELIRIEDLYD